MRALVTGAAGFIGSHLAEALLARGDEVVGIDCFTPYYDRATKEANLAAARTSPAFTFLELDLRTADLAGPCAGVDVVFHQAAQPGVRLSWSDGFAEYDSHNVLATQRLLEAACAAGVGRFVYASSSSVYGNQRRYPTTEDDLPRPFSPYGVTKLAAEHLCGLYAENRGLVTVSLRYFTVFGPRQRPDMSIHRLCEAALSGRPFPRYGDGSQVREFTFVDDIVAGNLLAAEAPDVEPGTVCNLAGGAEITLRDLIELVGEVAGTRVAVEAHPAVPGDAARNGGATDRAAAVLGWSPRVPLREGIEAQLAWHRSRRR
ncbi:MAG: putative UDP-glucose epimerase YtcB [Acidimicrobiia bacterium]|nr:MAG: putative UDP-glucose epimerase YtcB [Acidimicrobiia bacterium]